MVHPFADRSLPFLRSRMDGSVGLLRLPWIDYWV
jgi:hypothetical protein